MNKTVLNVAGIYLDASGRAVIDDESLRELEKQASFASAGGITNAAVCDGANAACINTGLCNGSTNVTCMNQNNCMITQPGRQ